MARRNFYEILNDTPLNLQAEYERIHKLFYEGTDSYRAIEDMLDYAFESLPEHLIGRTISLSDFNRTYNFAFPDTIITDPGLPFSPVDDLLIFCEYIWNFCVGLLEYAMHTLDEDEYSSIKHLQKMIAACMNDLGQMLIQRGKLFIFVPKDPAVISVAEIVGKELVVSILEYNHHSLRGDLTKKKAILKLLADDIEGDRQKLRNLNRTLETQLFQLLNKFVRHDQTQTPHIATMKPQEIEECYDDIYQMWLLAKLEIDHYTDRKNRIAGLIEKLNC